MIDHSIIYSFFYTRFELFNVQYAIHVAFVVRSVVCLYDSNLFKEIYSYMMVLSIVLCVLLTYNG